MVSAPPSAWIWTCSTLLRSMTTLPTSRDSRARVPLAESSMLSLTLAPLNTSVSVPSWPSTVSLPSPGFHTKVSLPVAQERGVAAAAAGDEVVAVAAEQQVVAVAAGDGVVAGTAIDGELRGSGRQGGGIDDVVAGERADDEPVIGGLEARDRDRSRQAVDGDRVSGADHLDGVLAGSAVDGHAIGCAVAGAAADRARQVDRDHLHVGSGEIVDQDIVGASQGGELDALDPVEVHGDAADVAGQLRPMAVGRDDHVLVDIRAVEPQRVEAVLAFDHIAAVARIPDERVVAGAQHSRCRCRGRR